MTHLSARVAAVAAATCAALLASFAASHAQAQCSTCATPTVAFSPVIAAPTTVVAAPAVVVAPRLGLFDRWRLRRWGLTAPVVAPTFATAFAPAQTTAFAPTYTAAFAPTYTAAFAPAVSPYVTSFAPLQRPVATTSFLPVTAAFAPTAIVQSAELAPVVSAPACSTCAATTPCSTCATCAPATSYVEQAAYAAPSSGCASCATGDSSVIYSTPSGEPSTPQPQIDMAAPIDSNYSPGPAPEVHGVDATGTSFEAPPLMPPANDRTARTPTVDVHTAVYRRPAGSTSVSTAAKPASRVAVDNGAWTTTGSR